MTDDTKPADLPGPPPIWEQLVAIGNSAPPEAWAASTPQAPQPAGRALTDAAATALVQSIVSSSERPIGMVAYGLLVLRAVERAHGIKSEGE